MKNFLINCVISDVETSTLCSFDILYEDDNFKKLAKKLCKNINDNNYSDISKKLTEYANNKLI
jgi:hypothetical protein|tara:strand:+ start:372 stop:560 length:189 start_codon:yes stop_codon:yes gene_type:complete